MAHHFMFDPEAARPDVTPAAESARKESSPSFADVAPGLDLAEVAAAFTAHGGAGITADVSADLALEIVLHEIVEQACLATPANAAAIVLERGAEWICRASAGTNAPGLGSRLDAEGGLSGACIKTETVQRCDDSETDSRVDSEACRNLGVRSVIILPLKLNDRLAGVFEVFASKASAFSDRDERTLEALSQGVLKNLQRAAAAAETEPLPISQAMSMPQPQPDPQPQQDTIFAKAVGESLSEKTRPLIPSDAVLEGQNAAADDVLQQANERTGSIRGVNFVTWVLGVAVLVCAVFLAIVASARLTGRKATQRTRAAVAAPTPLAGSRKSDGATTGGLPVGAKSSSHSDSWPAIRGGASTHSNTPPQAGSLSVYQDGKEIFHLSPTSGTTVTESRASETEKSPADKQSSTAGVEPAALYELSPEGAEGSLLHRVEPDYPEEARTQHIQGPVVLRVRAGRDGMVQEVIVLSGSPQLADAAIAAVKQWRFKPQRIEGRPAEIQTKVTLNFTLPKS